MIFVGAAVIHLPFFGEYGYQRLWEQRKEIN
jgi:hypothetical protein